MVSCGHCTRITIKRTTIHGLKETMHFFVLRCRQHDFLLARFPNRFWYGWPLGFGILAYGAAYFLVHDIFIHQRFKLFRNANNWYAKGVRRAHKMHHKHLGKEDGECFGMLMVPFKYFQKRKNRIRAFLYY